MLMEAKSGNRTQGIEIFIERLHRLKSIAPISSQSVGVLATSHDYNSSVKFLDRSKSFRKEVDSVSNSPQPLGALTRVHPISEGDALLSSISLSSTNFGIEMQTSRKPVSYIALNIDSGKPSSE
jgi:hypothetical protein